MYRSLPLLTPHTSVLNVTRLSHCAPPTLFSLWKVRWRAPPAAWRVDPGWRVGTSPGPPCSAATETCDDLPPDAPPTVMSSFPASSCVVLDASRWTQTRSRLPRYASWLTRATSRLDCRLMFSIICLPNSVVSYIIYKASRLKVAGAYL